ncbi:MAG: GNAT family N-acetyltransferase, partial [Gammaproteobacteria bacterium]|nr:GNAT family N-acetyltransferase [Gammaproteobacteria bacterium]
MQYKLIESLLDIRKDDWNGIAGTDYPFTRYEFLVALEQNNCVGETYGWHPRFITAWDGEQLAGAIPLYLKENSYGEFVFDHAWADAYHRSGIPYFPKHVVSIPYTPATGQRILVSLEHQQQHEIRSGLIKASLEFSKDAQVSSLHWLFTDKNDTVALKEQGFMLRLGCQFHWQNNNYSDFDEYLQTFSSQKRKKLKRERRRVKEQGITFEVLHGNELNDEQWQIYHQFYLDTFDRKWGMATLSLDFFKQIGRTMPENIVVVFAKLNDEYIASAFNVKGKDTLYGRHWGCNEDY